MATRSRPATANAERSAPLDPKVDALIARANDFAKPVLTYLRGLVHEAVPDVTESIKWGRPFFLLNGEILCNMVAFKAHCSFGFWAPEMHALLKADGVVAPNGGSSLGKIRGLADLPPRREMLRYITEGADFIRSGKATSPVAARAEKAPRPAIPIPDDFTAALVRSKKASRVFDGFSPSCKREYLEWITTAKRKETRERRIAEAVARIADGKTHNEEYRKA